MSTDIVAHFIAGYPNAEQSLDIARALAEGGAAYLEMQIPFSDPSADGPLIENASRKALENQYTVDQAMELLQQLGSELDIPVFLMSYGNILFSRGIKESVIQAKEAGSAGLIIPDLVYGRDEGLYDYGREFDIPVVPVITPSVSDARLNDILSLKPEWIYTALRSGITGSYTSLDESNLNILDTLKTESVKVMAGFGIQSADQVKILKPHCDAVVVGSALVKAINGALESKQSPAAGIKQKMAELLS